MATLSFTVDEALRVLRANRLLPDAIRDVRGDREGLRLTVPGGIDIMVRRESCANGVLRLAFSSDSWQFKLADTLGKVDEMIDAAIRPYPFLRRDNKSLVIDLNSAVAEKVKGVRVKDIELRGNEVQTGDRLSTHRNAT
ncbi:MAG: hypothetical protein MZV70_60310 [Desulfobacterales bacterium]|nr:hypothetical protein [Desulfobacterales bacterium]